MNRPNSRSAKAHVAFLNRFYSPDIAATAQMLSDLAEDLCRSGWNVTVITSNTSYDGEAADLPREELRNGVYVRRVASTGFGRGTIVGRMIDYASYFISAFVALFRIPRPNIIVAMSDPPFILLSAFVAGRLRGASICYWAQDVYPALASRLGVIRETALSYRFLHAVARHLLKACDLVVGLGPAMVSALTEEGAPRQRTIAIHNWADEKAVRPIAREDNWFLTKNGLQDKFVVLYSGNAGRGHTFDALCEVMLRLKKLERIAFVFIGGGKKSGELRAFAESHGLSNVTFLDYLPRSDLPYSLSAATVSVVTEDPAVAGLLLPSKTYGILASGRPIVFVGSEDSDVASIVRESGCGIVIAHDDPDALERAVLDLAKDRSLVDRLGKASRNSAETTYSRERATGQWSSVLRTLLAPTQR